MYQAHVDSLGGPLNDHIATTFGIVRNSILNELEHFRVVTGLIPDIMHDILEGMLVYSVSSVFCYRLFGNVYATVVDNGYFYRQTCLTGIVE